ncbi:hypothetical protein AC578_6930 [Pseudocercospora eumusae]|uniref:N-acetyltransferase domain-containing protein n=1 Tax=Pseudocercospora eumusae TaxID=321146 RepID=A0A139GYG8_9PEZI|nr:hypothetical protein AC578_6930 [Pseudocercospora eumusae]
MSLECATESHLDSLSTIVQRSFHSHNEYFLKTFPDTPLMRKWFRNLFLDAIHDSEYQLLIVRDPSSSSSVLGIILLNRGSEDAAVFKRQPPTSDHDPERYHAMLESEKSNTTGQTVAPHFGIELLGVDDEAKGKGYGKMLLREACRIADEEGMEIFVTANVGARAFYEREGFVTEEAIVLEGEDGYGQVRMVYRGK